MRLSIYFLAFFFTTISSKVLSQQATVEIQIGEGSNDNYLCWSPKKSKIRAIGFSEDVVVQLRSEQLVSPSGTAGFQVSDEDINAEIFDPKEFIDIKLPANEDWVEFYTIGTSSSFGSQDINIVAYNSDEEVLGEIPAMVRVRKDARSLSEEEKNKFLLAVRRLHDAGGFNKYWQAHSMAFMNAIHSFPPNQDNPLFLVWHRAFLLNFEQDLQKIDPDVALHYWKFDELPYLENEDETIFSPDFLGEVSDQSSIVRFNDSLSDSPNPWFNWRVSLVSNRPLERTNDQWTDIFGNPSLHYS